MPRVTFTATPLVWIEVLGEKPDPGQANRDDGGLIGSLARWLDENHIPAARVPGITSTGRMSLGFAPADAPRITAWLTTHGAVDAAAGTGET